jgi:hypothetical protein
MRNAAGLPATASLLALLACQQPPASPPPAAAPPARKPEKPLLLLDEDEAPGPGMTGADNRRCHVCHLNYVDEPMAAAHARANVGCAKCHGPSDAHIADESWASGGNGTAPDIMYPRAAINPACLACHPREKLSPKDHRDFFAGKSAFTLCTDCHGELHRLPQRKCRWK